MKRLNPSFPDPFTNKQLQVSATQRPYKGMIWATVQAPRKLFMPVLPMHSKGKLIFGLCQRCCDERHQDECDHTDEERQITGQWPTCELYKALEKGYKIVKIFEVDQPCSIFNLLYTFRYTITRNGQLTMAKTKIRGCLRATSTAS